MTLQVGEDIGEETHEGDQILFFVEGEGEAVLEGESSPVRPNDMVFVPAGTLHNFVNKGDDKLRLVTTYAPPEHPDGTVHDQGRSRGRRALVGSVPARGLPRRRPPCAGRHPLRWSRRHEGHVVERRQEDAAIEGVEMDQPVE